MKKSLETREREARRAAVRQGYMLRKSRLDGTWLIIDPDLNAIVAGSEVASANGANGWALEDVEEWLDQEPEE